MAAGFARAVNDWIATESLDHDPRLRASIVVPMQNAEFAVDEMTRVAPDQRFVQVLCWRCTTSTGQVLLLAKLRGCRKHGLPIGIHAGSGYATR